MATDFFFLSTMDAAVALLVTGLSMKSEMVPGTILLLTRSCKLIVRVADIESFPESPKRNEALRQYERMDKSSEILVCAYHDDTFASMVTRVR